MDLWILGLILCSTVMHAGWNLLARGQRLEMAFFVRMQVVIIVVGLLPVFISEFIAQSIPPRAWLYLVFSGSFCGVYFYSLARAYESSDFTIVYPVARALPVLAVGLGDVLRGWYPTLLGWLGMLLVAAGCFLVPLHTFKEFHLRRYFNQTTLWLLLTAGGTVGYSLLDKIAAEIVDPGPATAARYAFMFFLISTIVFTILRLMFKQLPLPANSIGWKKPVLAAVLLFGAYGLILWVFQVTHHAGYVVAFRQFSIIIGVVLAFVLYKERGLAVRLTGVFIITTGLVLIGLFGS